RRPSPSPWCVPTTRRTASRRGASTWTAPAARRSPARAEPPYALDVTIDEGGAVSPGVNAATPSLDAPPLAGRYRYLVYLTGDRSAAEDLAAETFEKAFRSWRRFDPRRASPRTWLCRI